MINARMHSWLALALLIVPFTGCAGLATNTKPVAGAESLVVEPPTYRVGDEWRYTSGTFSQVVGFKGDLRIVASNRDAFCQGCRYLLDRNGIVVKAFNAQATPVRAGNQGLRMLDFPLRVGKTWNQEIELRQVNSGAMRLYSNIWSIEAFEEITVRAGTFKAFRIGWR